MALRPVMGCVGIFREETRAGIAFINRPMMKMLFALLLPACMLPAGAAEIVVQGGTADREGAVVTFIAPKELRGELSLTGADGVSLPLQIDEAGHGVFVLPKLRKGSTATFTVGPREQTIFPVGVEVIRRADKVNFIAHEGVNVLPLMSYQTDPGELPQGVPDFYAHGAHLHPIFSPSGKVVTGNHPPDHSWHRGVWLAWARTVFQGREPDFWNMGKAKGGELTGEVRFMKLLRTWSGPVQGGFVSQHQFIDHTSGDEVPVLDETWEVTATSLNVSGKPLFLIDLISTQTCAGSDPLKLPSYPYGGLGVRGSRAWDQAEAATLLTSEGAGRASGDGKKARWVHLGGLIETEPTGIAVLVHPDNFRAPQTMRLSPEHPQISVTPCADGDWAIEPSRPYVSRYRLVVTDGKADAALLDRLWADYAEPLKVQCR